MFPKDLCNQCCLSAIVKLTQQRQKKSGIEMGVHLALGSDHKHSIWKPILWQLVQCLAFALIEECRATSTLIFIKNDNHF